MPTTRDALLDCADHLIRTRGYAAFSFADLAESTGIRSASVHHHFPKKEDLAATLIVNYVARLRDALEAIRTADTAVRVRLAMYAKRFTDSFAAGRLPFCAALAAEREALPIDLRKRVAAFFQIHLDWLSQIVREGIAAGELRDSIAPGRAALLLFSALEGGTLVGWALDDGKPVLSAFDDVLAQLERP